MEQQPTPEQLERNALRALAMAAEQYLKAQDELSRTFVGPQLQSAVSILDTALNDRWPKETPAESAA